jgi:hypothetical protein
MATLERLEFSQVNGKYDNVQYPAYEFSNLNKIKQDLIMRNTIKALMTVILLILSSTTWAEYIATGAFEGTVCNGIVIKSCEPHHNIVAVKGDDGKLHELSRSFDSVTEQNGKTCIINTKSSTGGILSFAINAINQPVFFEKTSSGELNEVDVEYMTFQCIKR